MRWIEQGLQDLRFGARSLVRTPGFALLAIVSLALGIMATTAMYSVVRAVVLDPFPYRDVDNLMSIRVADPGGRGGRTYYSTDQYLEFARRTTIFEGSSRRPSATSSGPAAAIRSGCAAITSPLTPSM